MEEYQDLNDLSEELFDLHQISVDPGQSSLRVDQFISTRLPKVSRSRIQAAIQAELILVNGKVVKPSFKISGGDEILIRMPRQTEQTELIAEDIPLNIVYEDDDLMVVYKDAGMIVHPAPGNYTGTLVNALAFYFNGKKMIDQGKLKNKRYGLVHRIDKDTSGLLVISKSEFVHAHLSRQFFDHTIEREYHALVWGEPKIKIGTISAHIGRDPNNRQRQCIFEEGFDGKHAVTHYELLESYYYTSLVKCKLETGRTHQIRVHMKFIGHPLFNDEKYGGDQILKGTPFNKYKQFVQNCFKIMPRMALHAKSLGFTHPVTGVKLFFDSELPDDFVRLLEKWRNYTAGRMELLEDENSDNN